LQDKFLGVTYNNPERIKVDLKRFVIGYKNVVGETAPKDVYRKRKISGLSPFDRVAWETMTGIQENCVSSFISGWARTTAFCFNCRGIDAYR
jgi:hypothetical protein